MLESAKIVAIFTRIRAQTITRAEQCRRMQQERLVVTDKSLGAMTYSLEADRW
jgi:hypothetical protein